MDRQELEDRLSALVRQAQQQAYKSAARTEALQRLTAEIFQHRSIIISESALGRFPRDSRDDIFNTAVHNFIVYLLEDHLRIEQYTPQRRDSRFYNVQIIALLLREIDSMGGIIFMREFPRSKLVRDSKVISWIQSRFLRPGGFLDKSHSKMLIKDKMYVKFLALDDLENFDIVEQIPDRESSNILNETPEQQAQQLYRLIEEDPDGIFSNETMRNYPDVNWRDLALKRSEGKKWAQIAEEDYRDLNVRPTALSNFFFARQEREPLSLILADYGVRRRRTRNRNN